MRSLIVGILVVMAVALPLFAQDDDDQAALCGEIFDDLNREQQNFLNLRIERMQDVWEIIPKSANYDPSGVLDALSEWAVDADVAAYHSQDVEETLPECYELIQLDVAYDRSILAAYSIPELLRSYSRANVAGNAYRTQRIGALLNDRYFRLEVDHGTFMTLIEGIGGTPR